MRTSRIRLPERSTALALSVVILAAMAVAAVWAIRVPVFEQPDEIAHADYAFALFDVGRPYHIDRPHLRTLASKQTKYLSDATGYREMRYNPYARVPTGYGTGTYFATRDASAPVRSSEAPPAEADTPYVASLYPAGYYAFVAAVMIAASTITHGSLFAAFFAARLANVALLGITLVAAYRIFRRSGIERPTSVLAVAALGFFPMESTISSYIQPDNLVGALYAVTLAVSLPRRRNFHRGERPASTIEFATIGILISAVCFTKLHYALALWLAVVPLVALRMRRSASFVVDAVAFAATCVALPAAATILSAKITPLGMLVSPSARVASVATRNVSLASSLSNMIEKGQHAFGDAYFGGVAFAGFWYHFGIRSGTIFPAKGIPTAVNVLIVLTVATLALFIVGEARVVASLASVAFHRSPIAALRLALAPSALNAYCIVSTMLIVIGALTTGGLVLQGRYWVPVTVGLALILFVRTPRLFPAANRRRARFAIASFAAACSIASAISGLFALQSNFYDATAERPTADSVADIDHVIVPDRVEPNADALTIRRDQSLRLSGYAVDMMTGLPAQVVVLTVDGAARAYDRNFGPDQALASIFEDESLLRSRFAFTLQGGALTSGTHVIRCYVTDRLARYRLAIRPAIHVRVI